jgi:Type IV secretion system pilin
MKQIPLRLFFVLIVSFVFSIQAFAQGADPDLSTPINESYFTQQGSAENGTLDSVNYLKTNFRYNNNGTKSATILPGFLPTKQNGKDVYDYMRPSGVLTSTYPNKDDTVSIYRRTGTSNLIMLTYYRNDNQQTYYYLPSTKKLSALADVQSRSGSLPFHLYLEQEHLRVQGVNYNPSNNQRNNNTGNNITDDPAEKKCKEDYEKAIKTDNYDREQRNIAERFIASGGSKDASNYEMYRSEVCKIKTPLISGPNPGTPGGPLIQPAAEFDKLPNPLGGAGIVDIKSGIGKVMNIVLMIAIPFITIMIMYSGFLFVAAYGNSEKLKTARSTLMWTLIGAALLLGATTLGTAIINTVRKIGGGTGAVSTTPQPTNAPNTAPTTGSSTANLPDPGSQTGTKPNNITLC